MARRLRVALAAAAVVVVVLVALAVPRQTAAPPAESVEAYVAGVVSAGLPGASVVVTRAGVVAQRVAAGSLSADSNVPVASLTKAVTATAVMRLAEQGRLNLDDPVRRHLPWFTMDDAHFGLITIRQVLNQSSGLTDASLGFNQYRVQPRTPREAVELLHASHLAYDPGSSWDYCNVNYWIAEALVEEVSGSPLPDFLQREIFGPLGMGSTILANETGSRPTAGGPEMVAHAYAFGRAVPVPVPRTFAGGAGGLWTTPDDLAKWALFQAGHGSGVGTVLSRDALAELHRRQSPLHEYKVGYALGWWRGEPADGGVPRISHSGSGAGFSTYLGIFPDDLTVSVVVNAGAPRADQIAADVLDIQHGTARRPLGATAAWADGVASAATIAVAAACGFGVRRRALRPETTRRANHLAAAFCFVAATVLPMVPDLATHVVGRQATWSLLFSTAPVEVACAALVWTACACLAITHVCSSRPTARSHAPTPTKH